MVPNVSQWYLDHWHGNYQHAPTDDRAWLKKGDFGSRVLHSGAWYSPSSLLPFYFVSVPGNFKEDLGILGQESR